MPEPRSPMPTNPELARLLWKWLGQLEDCLGSKAEPVFARAAWQVSLLAVNAPRFVAADPALRLITVTVIPSIAHLATDVERPAGRSARRLLNALAWDAQLALSGPLWLRDLNSPVAEQLLRVLARYRAEIQPRQLRLRPNNRGKTPS